MTLTLLNSRDYLQGELLQKILMILMTEVTQVKGVTPALILQREATLQPKIVKKKGRNC